MASKLAKDIIVSRRQYFIEKVKAPLMRSILSLPRLKKKKDAIKALSEIILLCSKYPEPSRERGSPGYCNYPNAHQYMDIWDEFFRYEDNPPSLDTKNHLLVGREHLFRAMERLFLCTYEHDPYYRDRIDWFVEKVVEKYLSGKLEPRLPTCPNRKIGWNEPKDKEAMLEWLQNLKRNQKEAQHVAGNIG